MRRSRSEMYQVDFVAALFGGFLLVWLSGANEADAVSKASGSVLMFQISAQLVFESADHRQERLSVLPVDVVSTACIDDKWLSIIYRRSSQLVACHGTPRLHEGNPADISSRTRLELARGGKQEVTAVIGSSIRLSPTQSVQEDDISWIGRALEAVSVSADDSEIAVSLNTHQVAIGSVHRSWNEKPRILVQQPHALSEGAVDQLPGSPGTVSLYMPKFKRDHAQLNSEFTELVAVEVKLIWDLGRRKECWTGRQLVTSSGDIEVVLDRPC